MINGNGLTVNVDTIVNNWGTRINKLNREYLMLMMNELESQIGIRFSQISDKQKVSQPDLDLNNLGRIYN